MFFAVSKRISVGSEPKPAKEQLSLENYTSSSVIMCYGYYMF